ncbi:hypothetical protein [Flavobacterium restrictum]|uniref:Uncharacterized protein n=1 Tax=Flavobacterium restrictum TaxID=2594428 RepID=A0A553DTZ2_9FLAO|nr:hypothetical protein [Flavobacterium restrictum]TRX36248.1 hypothetical protein FNW21_13875 [Flavobacterium restrictum]
MKKIKIIFKLSIYLIILTSVVSCDLMKKVFVKESSIVYKNNCGLLVFKDSIQYNLIHDYLEYQQETFENSASYPTALDEEKPLTDFEISKLHTSYRTFIKNQEDIAENNGVDLSVNPVPEILEDDEILQTLLNQDRMLVIDGIVYYYFDDCTLFKFPVGKDCNESIRLAKEYFSKYSSNVQNNVKPLFNFVQVDICNDEVNYRVLNTNIFCQKVSVGLCIPDKCHPEYVNIEITFPNYYQGFYNLTSCDVNIDGVSTVYLPTDMSSISSNQCGIAIVNYGILLPKYFPGINSTHVINVTANFSYTIDGKVETCKTTKPITFSVPYPCDINVSPAYVNNFEVAIEKVDNLCTAGNDSFLFDVTNGNPQIIGQSPNSIQLRYNCAGAKKIIIKSTDPNCPQSKEIIVNPIDPSLCCETHPKRNYCKNNITSSNGIYRLSVKMRERNNRIVTIIRSFIKNSNGKFKRNKADINGQMNGPLYFNHQTCNCQGVYNFVEWKSRVCKKMKLKHLFLAHKSSIENAVNPDSFNWFKRYWARKNNSPWQTSVKTSNVPNTIFKINCNNNTNICD